VDPFFNNVLLGLCTKYAVYTEFRAGIFLVKKAGRFKQKTQISLSLVVTIMLCLSLTNIMIMTWLKIFHDKILERFDENLI